MNLRFVSSALKGIAAAFIISVALLLVFSAIALNKQDPSKFLSPFAFAALYVSSVICGYITAHSHKTAHLPMSFLGGALYALVIFAISFLFKDNDTAASSSQLIYLLIPLCSVAGGIIASPKQKTLKNAKKRAIKKARA